jgi:heptosyltransferase-2
MLETKNLLIIKHGALGDVVRTSYFVKPIWSKWLGQDGGCRVWWLTSVEAVPLIRFNPFLERIVTSVDEISSVKFDVVFSLDDESEVLEKVSKISCDKIVGIQKTGTGSASYCESSRYWFDMGLRSIYGKEHADQLKKSNAKTHSEIFKNIFGVEYVDFSFYNSISIENRYKLFVDTFSGNRFSLGLNPFAGNRWPGKSLSKIELKKLLDQLSKRKFRGKEICVYFFGSETEIDDFNNYCKAEIKSDRVTVLNTNSNVLEFAAAVKSMDLIISADSLCLHLAAAQGISLITFFAPTSAAEIENRDNIKKIKSDSTDYCSYNPNADNATLTAERILQVLNEIE